MGADHRRENRHTGEVPGYALPILKAGTVAGARPSGMNARVEVGDFGRAGADEEVIEISVIELDRSDLVGGWNCRRCCERERRAGRPNKFRIRMIMMPGKAARPGNGKVQLYKTRKTTSLAPQIPRNYMCIPLRPRNQLNSGANIFSPTTRTQQCVMHWRPVATRPAHRRWCRSRRSGAADLFCWRAIASSCCSSSVIRSSSSPLAWWMRLMLSSRRRVAVVLAHLRLGGDITALARPRRRWFSRSRRRA